MALKLLPRHPRFQESFQFLHTVQSKGSGSSKVSNSL